MAEFPALPLFTDAYLGDTIHLTTLQHGAYFMMLMVAWRSKGCCLPNDDGYLAKITGMDKRTWLANKTTLLSFWKLDDLQNWYQARLKDERNYVEDKRNKNARAGKASALKRLNRGSTYVIETLQPNGNISPTPTLTLTLTPKKEEKNNLKVIPKEKRGSRISDDFDPDGSCHVLADELFLSHKQCQDALANFTDYWKGVSGSKGTKLDWQATFRNQLRHVAKTSKGNQNERRKTNSESGEIALAAVKRKLAEVENEINPFGSIDGQSFEINPNVSRLFKS